ncbi:SDR family oxidoreductase [Arcobacter sp. CECT 8983]|uniref:SDR family oxidoreductase n=1 Tax=Arcobacter sp. CECT 8983 TaxID=2044508 RepID=UPI002159EE21|nr:SDR family oxidoreductase [Arcobacter sp. CECT 8983]
MKKNIFCLDSDVILLTGGAGLLGSQYTEVLLESGATVVVFDINAESLNTLENRFSNMYKNKIFTYKVDITKESDILNAKDEIFNKINKYPNVLINNAAIDPKFDNSSNINKSRLENFSIDQWNLEISVGLTGAMLCSKIFGIEMAKNNKGVIINVSSDLGVIAPDQRLYKKENLSDFEQDVKPVTYSVIKHGIIGLTKYIASYWADKGVRCNAFAPGGVFNNHSKDFLDKIEELIPMKRMANIDEYNATIIYLCSEASSYMNGAILNMDGGRTII